MYKSIANPLEVAMCSALPQFADHTQFPIGWGNQPQADPAPGCQPACLLRGLFEPPPALTMSWRPLHQNLGRTLRMTSSGVPALMIITDGLGGASTLVVDRQTEFRDWSQD